MHDYNALVQASGLCPVCGVEASYRDHPDGFHTHHRPEDQGFVDTRPEGPWSDGNRAFCNWLHRGVLDERGEV